MLCRRWAHIKCFAGSTGRTHGTTAGYCVAGKCAQYRNIRPFKKIEGLKCLCPLSNSLFEIQTYDGFLHCLHLADLGSNIGMFSVTAATLGRKVVAVDASIQNLAYIDKSVHLNGNQENVKLINNAVRCLDWSQYFEYIVL